MERRRMGRVRGKRRSYKRKGAGRDIGGGSDAFGL